MWFVCFPNLKWDITERVPSQFSGQTVNPVRGSFREVSFLIRFRILLYILLSPTSFRDDLALLCIRISRGGCLGEMLQQTYKGSCRDIRWKGIEIREIRGRIIPWVMDEIRDRFYLKICINLGTWNAFTFSNPFDEFKAACKKKRKKEKIGQVQFFNARFRVLSFFFFFKSLRHWNFI